MNRRKRLRRACALALAAAGGLVVAILSLAWADGTQAASRPLATPMPASAGSAETIGLASPALDCLAAGSKAERAAGDVALAWTGQAERARLILRAAGNQVAQPVRVNGHLVGYVPAAVGSEVCWGEPVYLDVPVSILAQGQNRIEISAEALPGDEWSAAQVRLEVIGPIGRPVVEGALAEGGGPVSLTVQFENAYDDTPQEAWLQVPSGYQGSVPAPVVVYVHGRTSYMYEPAEPGNQFAAEAEARGWLLVSPEMHGRWPGTGAVPTPDPPGKYAYASMESQYDVIGALQYVLGHYNVQRERLYLIGPSMGGQIGAIAVAKYPDVFAAATIFKAPSDMAQWHGQSTSFHQDWMERECYTGSSSNPTPQPPSQNPVCYARRSGQMFASNYVHVPVTLSHSLVDALVPVTHSFQLRDRINSFGPDQPAIVYVDTVVGPTCPYTPPSPPGYHCFEPPAEDVFDFFQQHTLDNTQLDLNVTTDEPKPFYWLNLDQTGSAHWSQARAVANLSAQAVTLTVSDTQTLNLGINLGTDPITGTDAFVRPGLGFMTGTYTVSYGVSHTLVDYTTGYLSVTAPLTGQYVVTITRVPDIIIPPDPEYLIWIPFARK